MRSGVTRLKAFPRNRLLDVELVRGRVSELDLLAAFDEPTTVRDRRDAEPAFFWDLEWPCGLVMDLTFHQLSEELRVRLDATEIDHALRHLGFRIDELERLDQRDPEAFRAAGEPSELVWGLWCHDDDDTLRLVAAGLAERDARCWLDELRRDGDLRHELRHMP